MTYAELHNFLWGGCMNHEGRDEIVILICILKGMDCIGSVLELMTDCAVCSVDHLGCVSKGLFSFCVNVY